MKNRKDILTEEQIEEVIADNKIVIRMRGDD